MPRIVVAVDVVRGSDGRWLSSPTQLTLRDRAAAGCQGAASLRQCARPRSSMLVGRRGGRRAFAMVFTDLTAGRMDALIGNAWAVLSGRRVGENGMCWSSPSIGWRRSGHGALLRNGLLAQGFGRTRADAWGARLHRWPIPACVGIGGALSGWLRRLMLCSMVVLLLVRVCGVVDLGCPVGGRSAFWG
jgi:hypothetical protein